MNDAHAVKTRALIREWKRRNWLNLSKDPNCLGAAFGQRITHGELTGEPAMVVYVARKIPTQFLPPSRILPRRIYVGRDMIEVDVLETGFIYPLSFTARDRPAPSGISIGHPNITAGTLGCLVTDKSDNALCILSNNHVIANQNAAAIGDPTIQPGTIDGGVSPPDDIAKLKRFVTITAAGNTVDGAIAQVGKKTDVVDQMKNNLMPIASSKHPALGLLFAGSCNRTIMNPINDVLNQLNIQFTSGAGSTAAAEIGMNVEKVGRTTEYTTSTITEVDVTVNIPYDFGNATFDNQIATAWMSDGGDSGSLVCKGGKGGNEDHCSCGTMIVAESLFGVDLKTEAAMAQNFRDKYLRQTKIGRWGVELFDLNEARLIERLQSTEVKDTDRGFARKLYSTYIDEARKALAQPENEDLRLTNKHLSDAKVAFGRARKYLSKEESHAANELLKLATKAKNANLREVLTMLNDEKLFEQVREIVKHVKTLKTSKD